MHHFPDLNWAGVLHLQRHVTIYETLKRIGDAEARNLDAWHVALSSGASSYIFVIDMTRSATEAGSTVTLELQTSCNSE